MNQRAFTILELVGALSLCLILAAVGVLGYERTLAAARLGNATRQVVMDLKLARARAILGAASHRVRFPVPGTSYQHERQRPSGTYEALGAATELPPDVTVVGCSGAGSGISFRPRGHAGAFGTIVLRNRDGAERAVVVDIVGRLRVQ
jgi:type II secretory pathway pseudopilin PulG